MRIVHKKCSNYLFIYVITPVSEHTVVSYNFSGAPASLSTAVNAAVDLETAGNSWELLACATSGSALRVDATTGGLLISTFGGLRALINT